MRAGRGLLVGLVTSIAGLALLVTAGQALACSCVGPMPGEKREFNRKTLKAADAAVFAKVLRYEELEQPGGEQGAVSVGGPADYVLRVRRGYKRPRALSRGTRITVRSNTSGATCGLGQRTGVSYGLLLYKDSAGRWTSNLCSVRSRRDLRRAWRDLERRRSGATSRSNPAVAPCGPRNGPGRPY